MPVKINFVKMVASGNDFVVLKGEEIPSQMKLKALALRLCERKLGIGADGVLVLGPSKKADAAMRIFNADGSEAEMCGNGARCAAYFACKEMGKQRVLSLETKAGIVKAEVRDGEVKVKLTDPSGTTFDIPLKIQSRQLKVNFINTGVPHAVVFVNGLEKIDVGSIGRQIRYHRRFQPAGTNVNFVEINGADAISVRTYERGVEDETLACGTGSCASALIFSLKSGGGGRVRVSTKSGEILKVSFQKIARGAKDVWLEGKAGEVFKGSTIV